MSEIKTDTVEISTSNLALSTRARSIRVSPSDCDNENDNVAAKTGNIYISGIMTDRIEIPTANLEIWVFDNTELEETVSGRLQQRPTTGNGNIDVLGANLAILGCRRCRNHLVTLLSN